MTLNSKSRDCSQCKVLREIQNNNKLLVNLVERVTKAEKWLKAVEGTVSKASSSSSCSSGIDSTPSRSRRHSNTKDDVPQPVRVSSLVDYALTGMAELLVNRL